MTLKYQFHQAIDLITFTEVRAMFFYDGKELRWRKHYSRYLSHMNGKIAGTVTKDGYRRVRIKDKAYKCHRLIWFYIYGVWPTKVLDHINRKPLDNRIENLREVDQKTNVRNLSVRGINSSGTTGVAWHKAAKKWRAYITVDGKNKHLGLFKNKIDAINTRRNYESKHGFIGE